MKKKSPENLKNSFKNRLEDLSNKISSLEISSNQRAELEKKTRDIYRDILSFPTNLKLYLQINHGLDQLDSMISKHFNAVNGFSMSRHHQFFHRPGTTDTEHLEPIMSQESKFKTPA